MRPGRLDVQLYCPPPDQAGRLQVLQVHCRAMPLAPDVDLAAVAEQAEGFSGRWRQERVHEHKGVLLPACLQANEQSRPAAALQHAGCIRCTMQPLLQTAALCKHGDCTQSRPQRHTVAAACRHCAGAELAALCREAALAALREDLQGAQHVAARHLEAAMAAIKPALTPFVLAEYEAWRRAHQS
jgi:SpoVK/Ycf46/Vps4 family AAA+-type ATPase